MASVYNSGLGHGTNGSPQGDIKEQEYPIQVNDNEDSVQKTKLPVYRPSKKHEKGHNFGSINPINDQSEGQELLDSGYLDGKQYYNITRERIIAKFQPDNTPENGYHSYEVSSPRDIPPSVLKRMYSDGKISRNEYNKFRKGKK